ncbi:MAG: hypothetical protein ACOCVG_01870 [Verrucomicrobiota bacterium]
MEYPITLSFKVLAIASQIYAKDAQGNPLLYVRQKAFRLREKIEVFTDDRKEDLLARIETKQIIDFSAGYTISDPEGNPIGTVRRRGMRSIWKATYEIVDNDGRLFTLRESNPWAKVGDSFLGDVPVVGLLSGYLFHPKFTITAEGSETPSYLVAKQPSLFESQFVINKLDDEEDDILILLAVLLVALLERRRG